MRSVRRQMRIFIVLLLLVTSPLVHGESYEEYWEGWHQAAKEVEECDSVFTAIGFIDQALLNLGNAERSQANSEVIEKLIIEFPDCFCNAFVELSNESQKKVKKFFLQT